MTEHYLLACSISADVRQSVQIKFDDLKLPQSVIDTLEQNNTVGIRPNLSNALKAELDALRVMQRELYDSYCIHFGETHFVTKSYFAEAKELISKIKSTAQEANERLKEVWESEFISWQNTAENILRPLFIDDIEYKLALDAYMKFFPTKQAYSAPIRVHVLGPLPVSLYKVDKPIEDDLDSIIAYENQINTEQILSAARNNAADRALLMSAELLDDLDCRSVTKIGKQQTGSDKKRGSWQLTANKLKLISDSVAGFENLSQLAEKLLDTANDMQSPARQVRQSASKMFFEVQEEIREELENICNTRNESSGLKKLQESLALSSKYKTLCERVKTVEDQSSLDLLIKEVDLEKDIYAMRSKHLTKLINQRTELITVGRASLDSLISEVKQQGSTDENLEADF